MFATNATLQAGDSVNGGAGTDTLFYTDASAAGVNLVATALSGIENLYVQNVAGTAAVSPVIAVSEVQSVTLGGAGAASTGTSTVFLGVATTVTATHTAAQQAATIVANKSAILAGATAQALGITDISVVGTTAELRITFGGTNGTGDVAALAASATSNGVTFTAGTEITTGKLAVTAVSAVTPTQTIDATTLTETVQFWNNTSTNNVVFNNIQQAATIGVKGVTSGSTTEANFATAMTTGTADSVSIALDGSTSAGTITIGAGFETVNVSAAGKNTVAGLVTGAKTVNITGAGDLTITATIADATKIDGSAATGKLTLTSAVAKVDIDTGTGADKVTLGHAASANHEVSVSTGAGNDTVVIASLAAAAELVNDKVTIDGGAGTDTLEMKAALAVALGDLTAANYAKKGIVNFEKLAISDALANASSTDTDRLGLSSGITLKAGVTTAATLNNVANGGTVTLAAANTGDLTIAVKNAAVAGSSSDVLNISLAGVHTTGGIDYDDLIVANVETININSTSGKTTPLVTANTNTIETLVAIKAEAINISGNVKFILEDALANTYTALKTINASDNTAGVDISAASVAQGITITGTAAADAITGGAGNDLINAGAGNDTVNSSAGVDVISLGAGTNVFDVNDDAHQGVTIATADRITDWSVGSNVINIAGAGTYTAVVAQSSVQLAVNNLITAGTTTFDGILAAIGAATGPITTGTVGSFQFEGNTFVFANITNGIAAAADFVIQLDGLHTLTADSFVIA